MALTLSEKKRVEIEANLKEANLMDAEDTIEENTAGDYYPLLEGQVRGNYYFTKERVIFVSGWGLKSFSIKYTDIREIKKSLIGPFLPFGVTVTADNQEKGKTKKYKFSLMKRKYWMDLLSRKSGVTL